MELVPLSEGRVIDAGEFTIDCFRVRHRDTDSFGFSFESQARRHLLPDRLAALRVPDGPVRKFLAEGKPVTLDDGRTIDPEDVLGPPVKRKKLVVVGDTKSTDALSDMSRVPIVGDRGDVSRSRFRRGARLWPSCRGGSGCARAESGVKQLVLTHISGRYPDEEILAEATRMFPDSRVAADLDHFVV